jgi:hypothetical protein
MNYFDNILHRSIKMSTTMKIVTTNSLENKTKYLSKIPLGPD